MKSDDKSRADLADVMTGEQPSPLPEKCLMLLGAYRLAMECPDGSILRKEATDTFLSAIEYCTPKLREQLMEELLEFKQITPALRARARVYLASLSDRGLPTAFEAARQQTGELDAYSRASALLVDFANEFDRKPPQALSRALFAMSIKIDGKTDDKRSAEEWFTEALTHCEEAHQQRLITMAAALDLITMDHAGALMQHLNTGPAAVTH
ncbi:MAG: hypothetical protein CMI01_18405 [Oceanospirillaceae bacterium]|nr:hypothetical protein [Oceanospirillaceae bacterium]